MMQYQGAHRAECYRNETAHSLSEWAQLVKVILPDDFFVG